MKCLSACAVVLAIASWGCSNKTPTSPDALKPMFTATLSPANEVPPVTNAESAASGSVTITLNTTKDAAGNVTSATATFDVKLLGFPAGSAVNIAHIHEGAPTCACPVVVNTTLAAGQVTFANGAAAFIREGIAVNPPEVAQRLLTNPAGFYFNVHTALNGGGAVRGTLARIQ